MLLGLDDVNIMKRLATDFALNEPVSDLLEHINCNWSSMVASARQDSPLRSNRLSLASEGVMRHLVLNLSHAHSEIGECHEFVQLVLAAWLLWASCELDEALESTRFVAPDSVR